MKLNPKPHVRVTLYVLTMLLSPVIAYLQAKGIMGSLEVALWSAEVSVVAGLAAYNINPER